MVNLCLSAPHNIPFPFSGFVELEKNVTYFEREDEFDLVCVRVLTGILLVLIAL